MSIYLYKMTRSLMRSFFQEFAYDPDTFHDSETCDDYHCSQAAADAFYDKHNRSDRVHFAIMQGNTVIGDLYLKNINQQSKNCTLSIHMKNDSVKNKGYGSCAEYLALNYAFDELGLETVNADALIKNKRSRHVLEKVGFLQVGSDEKTAYYSCEKSNWSKQKATTID